jgi:hypothetical protein
MLVVLGGNMIYLRSRALVASAFVLGCIFTVVLSQGNTGQKIDDPKNGISINDVKEYRNMFRVNAKPIDMVKETMIYCAEPRMHVGPHYNPGVVYYINEITRQGIKTYSDTKQFPVGSIIVKEKQESKTEDSVHIITVMKKVRADSSEGSWDYKMFDVREWAEVDPSRQIDTYFGKGCIGCHRQYKDNDYVSGRGIELLLGKSRSRK